MLAMRWKNQLWVAIIGASSFLVTASAGAQKHFVDPTEAYNLAKTSLTPEISKLPNLQLMSQDRNLSRMSFSACAFRRLSDSKFSCEELASLDVYTSTGQVCMRVPARDFIRRDVSNPKLLEL